MFEQLFFVFLLSLFVVNRQRTMTTLFSLETQEFLLNYLMKNMFELPIVTSN